jgi:membrane protein
MPNTRSSLLSAILGGCMASALWQLLLWAHIRFQLGIANHNEVYAGFAAIPVFLVWLQMSWVTVLLGAELAFAHEHEPSYRGLALYEELDANEREVLALRAAAGLTEVFLDRGGALSAAHLAGRLGVQPHDVESVLRALETHGLVIAAEDEDEGGRGFALARDPGAVTLKDVSDALRKGARPPERSGDGRRRDALETLLERLDEDMAGSAHNIDLRELVRREQRDREARTSGAEEPGVQLS